MTDKLYHHCMMCDLVSVDGVRMRAQDFTKAYPSKSYTSGVCESKSCLDQYCIEVIGDDNLIDLILEDLHRRR